MRLFIPDFHCQMENNKAAPKAPSLWVFVVSHLAVETRHKKTSWKSFLLKAGPTIGPKLKTDFGWCRQLIKHTRVLNKKHTFFNGSTHYSVLMLVVVRFMSTSHGYPTWNHSATNAVTRNVVAAKQVDCGILYLE